MWKSREDEDNFYVKQKMHWTLHRLGLTRGIYFDFCGIDVKVPGVY